MTTNPVQQPPANVQIGLGAQYIKDFSFENPNVPQIFTPSQTPPELKVDVNVQTRAVSENTYEATLNLKMQARIGDKTAFIAELSYGGIFILPQLPEEQLKIFLLVEAPRHLFPYARAILSNAVRDGGYPQIAIAPIDFMGLYLANKNNVGTMSAAGAA